jgi:hypothetical protein
MFYHTRESDYRQGAGAYSYDPLLAIAYLLSEQAITFLGPTFWTLLAYLFVVEELAH